MGREVDKKREELRVMVGERYRDLIEAADTIQNMKLSAGQVITQRSLDVTRVSTGEYHDLNFSYRTLRYL